ncbi:MAG: hypothetical protein ACK4GT_20000, partial [Pararhodobacter sp.]
MTAELWPRDDQCPKTSLTNEYCFIPLAAKPRALPVPFCARRPGNLRKGQGMTGNTNAAGYFLYHSIGLYPG